MTATPVRPSPLSSNQHSPPARRAVFRADVGASLVVFLVAVPLSLGIALASGAPIMAGLIAAVVGGVVAGLLGGSPFQVSGPAAGLTVVVAELVARFGWEVTCLITAGAGLVQILFGFARVARFSQAIPPAVVHGMLAGIGLTIVAAQMHVVVGGAPPAGALDSILALPAALMGMNGGALAVGIATIAVLLAWPRLPRRVRVVPGPLVAVAAGTAFALLWTGVPLVDLPGGLLDAVITPNLSLLPEGQWGGIIGGVLTVALIASIESLLSAVAVDRMHDGPRTKPDRELLGQGAANTISGFLGGLPVTGVIVRSAANVEAGARSRAAAILHGVWIAVFAIALVGVIELIPLAALAGLLVFVGLQLVKPADVRAAKQHGELPIYLVTVVGVLALNLLEGVAIGLVLAGLLLLRRVVWARVHHELPVGDGPQRIVVEGRLSFLAVPALSRALARVPHGEPVHVDLAVDYFDHTAFDHLESWTARHRASGALVEVSEPTGTGQVRRGRFATWSHWQRAGEQAPVLAGVAAYHSEAADLIRPSLRAMAGGQSPSALLFCCADSRVLPNVITQSGPGDLFTVQNVGNLVTGTSEQAAVQYATAVLGVPVVAVCGHSGCGAMTGLLDGGLAGPLGDWLQAGQASLEAFRAGHPVGAAATAAGYGAVEALSMVNVALQLETLRDSGVDAELLGLYFDIPTARVLVLDVGAQEFRPAP